MIVDVVIVVVEGDARDAERWLTSRYRGRSLFLICGVILNTDAPSHAFLDVVAMLFMMAPRFVWKHTGGGRTRMWSASVPEVYVREADEA